MRSLPWCLCAAAGASVVLLGTLGCNGALAPQASASSVVVTGNWQLGSTAASAAKLPSLSGELTGSGSALTGILHSDSAASCVAPGTAIEVAGSASAANVLTLTGGNVAGGTLTITGTLAADGRSLTDASYTVTGGSCAFAQAATVHAQAYSSITGNYAGTFSDASGPVMAITANLAQNPASDTTGNFTLSGSGSFGANPCFSSPVQVSNSQVTGGSFTLSYTDVTLGNTVTANGTFSTDGKTLTVTQWSETGSCGADTGTGTLTKQ